MAGRDLSQWERLGGDKVRAEADSLIQLVRNPLGRNLLLKAGVSVETIEQVNALANDFDARQSDIELIPKYLLPLGWCLTSDVPDEIYRHAARLAAEGDATAATEHLIQGWNEDERMAHGLRKFKSIAVPDHELRQNLMRRWELLRKALVHHQSGAYEASVPLVLAQMDGIVIDMTGNSHQDFFGGGEHLVDEVTLAGHPDGLQAIARAMGRDVKRTASTGELRRHGIMHGRELGYDTIENSTKVFAALFALIEWAQPRARAAFEAEEKAREARYAGSREVDPDGHRLDTRGFGDAKASLHTIAFLQYGHFQRLGKYANALSDLLPPSKESLVQVPLDQFVLGASPLGDEYWLSVSTTAGFFFGVAGRNGEHPLWLYAGEHRPIGGIGEDDWRHVLGDPAHRDW